MATWNLWHGCRKVSSGCLNCYVYRRDAEFGKDSSIIVRTSSFALPVKRNRKGTHKLQSDGGAAYTRMTSDFFVEEVDEWRPEAWKMTRERDDLHFVIITKRIHRFQAGLPKDWGKGHDNVTICCTYENQNMADYRLPISLNLPTRHRMIIHKPMLEWIEIRRYPAIGLIEQATCGGEPSPEAKACDYARISEIMQQCVEYDIPFWFKQIGVKFKKGNRIYHIERKDQMYQAEKAGVNYRYEGNNQIGDTSLHKLKE